MHIEFREFEKVGNTVRLFERLIQFLATSDQTKLRQNSSRSSGILANAFRKPSSDRAMPQLSHMSLPSSLWKESGLRYP